MPSYTEVRDQFRTGDILAFAGNGFISRRIINYDGIYSHVAMILKKKPYYTVRMMITHSTFRAEVHDVPTSNYTNGYKGKVWWVPMLHEKVKKKYPHYQAIITDYSLVMQGTPYDWKGPLSYIIPWMKQSESGLYCSEYAATALQRIGITDTSVFKPSEVTKVWCYDTPRLIDGP